MSNYAKSPDEKAEAANFYHNIKSPDIILKLFKKVIEHNGNDKKCLTEELIKLTGLDEIELLSILKELDNPTQFVKELTEVLVDKAKVSCRLDYNNENLLYDYDLFVSIDYVNNYLKNDIFRNTQTTINDDFFSKLCKTMNVWINVLSTRLELKGEITKEFFNSLGSNTTNVTSFINEKYDVKSIEKELESNVEKKKVISEWMAELIKIQELFKAPTHFTPFYSGTALALCYLFQVIEADEHTSEERLELKEFYHRAVHDLKRSQGTYTMQRAYYEMISTMHYFYDDFNDRQIHFHHAIQMGGSEITCFFLEMLEAFKPRTYGPLAESNDDKKQDASIE